MTGAAESLLGPADIRRLAGRIGLRPTKALGQNFVHDANTVRRIVAASGVEPADHVLEVGPGFGSLTLALLPAAATVSAVELDPQLADLLPETVANRCPGRSGSLRVVTGDALHLDAADLRGEPTALVANLPYNVAVPVLLHLLAEFDSLRRVLVMVQAEVADRLVASPGSRVYGAPSVKLAWYGEAWRAGSVSRSVFWPAPRVDSALVGLRRARPPGDTGTRSALFDVVDAAFAQRRKTLRAALANWAGSTEKAEQVCRAAGVDPGLRGETLALHEFLALAAHGGEHAGARQGRQRDSRPSPRREPRRAAGRGAQHEPRPGRSLP